MYYSHKGTLYYIIGLTIACTIVTVVGAVSASWTLGSTKYTVVCVSPDMQVSVSISLPLKGRICKLAGRIMSASGIRLLVFCRAPLPFLCSRIALL